MDYDPTLIEVDLSQIPDDELAMMVRHAIDEQQERPAFANWLGSIIQGEQDQRASGGASTRYFRVPLIDDPHELAGFIRGLIILEGASEGLSPQTQRLLQEARRFALVRAMMMLEQR